MSEALALTDQYRKIKWGTALTVPYTSVGSSLSLLGRLNNNACIVSISSTLNQPVWISFDGVNLHLLILNATEFSNQVLDLKTNGIVLANNTPIYIQNAGTGPTSGAIYFCYAGL